MSRTDAFIAGTPVRAPQPGLDRAAIEALIAKQYTGLRLLILRRAGNPEVAADLLNEALCKTWEKWQAGLIQHPEQIGGYIFQVAMNLLRNLKRSVPERVDRRAAANVLDELPANTDATDRWLEKKIALRVKRILQDLSVSRDREVLTRLYLHDEDKEAICRDLSMDAEQFDKVLHRARGRLRELLESRGFKKADFFMFFLA